MPKTAAAQFPEDCRVHQYVRSLKDCYELIRGPVQMGDPDRRVDDDFHLAADFLRAGSLAEGSEPPILMSRSRAAFITSSRRPR